MDLESGEGFLNVLRICGSESIVAALVGEDVVTVWSSKEEMGRLHSFDVGNHEGFEDCWVYNIKVTGNKVVFFPGWRKLDRAAGGSPKGCD